MGSCAEVKEVSLMEQEKSNEINLDELVELEEDVSPATGGGCGGLC